MIPRYRIFFIMLVWLCATGLIVPFSTGASEPREKDAPQGATAHSYQSCIMLGGNVERDGTARCTTKDRRETPVRGVSPARSKLHRAQTGARLRVAPGTYVPVVAIRATEIPPSQPLYRGFPEVSTTSGEVFSEPQKPERSACKDLCGDGICQEMVCMAVGCPCAESAATCPADCSELREKDGLARTLHESA